MFFVSFSSCYSHALSSKSKRMVKQCKRFISGKHHRSNKQCIIQPTTPYTPPGWDLYCSSCRLYGPTYMCSPHIPLEEVKWEAGEEVIRITSRGGYLDNLLGRLCEF